MSQYVEVPVIHRTENALGLFLSRKSEAGVDRANRAVELPQEIVGIVERSIRKDVHFG
jgi:hypothetical protein